jgi:hypothetical protein
MPYDMRIRTSAGWMNMTDMIAFRKIHSQQWTFTTTQNIQNVSRQIDVSLRDHTDFNGKNFEIFIKGNTRYTGAAPSTYGYEIWSNYSLIWNGGSRIVSGSTIRLMYNNPILSPGNYVVNMDAYIMET